jgi:hypothetical protein
LLLQKSGLAVYIAELKHQNLFFKIGSFLGLKGMQSSSKVVLAGGYQSNGMVGKYLSKVKQVFEDAFQK